MSTSASALTHLKIRHLKLIVLLIEHGTLHKAARVLSISQPAASAMLNDLEATLGVSIFERSHRGVRLTGAGEQIIDAVRTLLHEFDNLATTIERLNSGRERMLRVGVVPQAFATYLPGAIRRFRAGHEVAIKTEEGTARHLLARLWEGHLDCVIGRLPSTGLPEGIDDGALHFEILYTETICIACGAGAMGRSSKPTHAWLGRQEWVLQRRDSSVRQALNESFLRHGMQPPKPIVETANYMQCLALVAGSNFFTVAPRHAAGLQESAGLIRVLDVDLGVPPMQVSFIRRISGESSVQLNALAEAFRSAVQDQQQGHVGKFGTFE